MRSGTWARGALPASGSLRGCTQGRHAGAAGGERGADSQGTRGAPGRGQGKRGSGHARTRRGLTAPARGAARRGARRASAAPGRGGRGSRRCASASGSGGAGWWAACAPGRIGAERAGGPGCRLAAPPREAQGGAPVPEARRGLQQPEPGVEGDPEPASALTMASSGDGRRALEARGGASPGGFDFGANPAPGAGRREGTRWA